MYIGAACIQCKDTTRRLDFFPLSLSKRVDVRAPYQTSSHRVTGGPYGSARFQNDNNRRPRSDTAHRTVFLFPAVTHTVSVFDDTLHRAFSSTPTTRVYRVQIHVHATLAYPSVPYRYRIHTPTTISVTTDSGSSADVRSRCRLRADVGFE